MRFGHKARLDGIPFGVSNPRHEFALASNCDIVESRLPDRAVRAASGIIGPTKRALDVTHDGRNVVTYPGTMIARTWTGMKTWLSSRN